MTFWPSPPAAKSAGDLITSADHDKLIDMGIHLKERLDGLTPFTNSDAGALAYGQLLVQDAASGERKLKKSAASAGAAGPFFVGLGTVAIAGTGYAAHMGFVDLKYTGTAPVAGDQLQSSATAGLAMVGTTNPLAVAYADGSGGTVQAILYGPGGSAGGGGSVFSTSTDGLVPGPSGSEDDASHVLGGDGSWVDTSAFGGGGSGLGQLSPLVIPTVAGFTVVNGTGATFTDEADGIYALSAASSGNHARMLTIPYTAPAKLRVGMLAWLPGAGNVAVGLACLTNTTTSNPYLGFEYLDSSSLPKTAIERWSAIENGSVTATTNVAGYLPRAPLLWMELEDTNTDLVARLSADGRHWDVEQYRQARTTHITPGGFFGIFLQTFSASQAAAIKILHAELL